MTYVCVLNNQTAVLYCSIPKSGRHRLLDCRHIYRPRFLANVRNMPSLVRLSSVCLSVTFVRHTQAIGIFGNVSKHLVRWPSADIQVKFYGDRPRGTPPSGELNTRGVAEYSDFGPVERYIVGLEQERTSCNSGETEKIEKQTSHGV